MNGYVFGCIIGIWLLLNASLALHWLACAAEDQRKREGF